MVTKGSIAGRVMITVTQASTVSGVTRRSYGSGVGACVLGYNVGYYQGYSIGYHLGFHKGCLYGSL